MTSSFNDLRPKKPGKRLQKALRVRVYQIRVAISTQRKLNKRFQDMIGFDRPPQVTSGQDAPFFSIRARELR
jgi:hypothetical protein